MTEDKKNQSTEDQARPKELKSAPVKKRLKRKKDTDTVATTPENNPLPRLKRSTAASVTELRSLIQAPTTELEPIIPLSSVFMPPPKPRTPRFLFSAVSKATSTVEDSEATSQESCNKSAP